MRLGLHALGIGSGARREVIDAVARAAEDAGFATLWAGEHVVMVDRSASRYPYNDAGEIPVPADADWLDPLVCLSFAAAATERITLATGILLLAEHNPVLVAKQAATLDVLSGGRLTLGVGIGWSREEFEALGVPFAHRGDRVIEYVEAIRVLWREDSASFAGRFASFDSIRVYPKPVRDRRLPIVFGGNSDPALARVSGHGDGWYGFNVEGVQALRDRIVTLRELCLRAQRDPAAVSIAAAVTGCEPSDIAELEQLGVGELVLIETPPDDPSQVPAWVGELARRWHVPRPQSS